MKHILHSDKILSCSVGEICNDSGFCNEAFNDGPVYGPNGEWELDPDNDQCWYPLPVFATCKNNCPGGEL